MDKAPWRFPRAACLILDLEKAFDTLTWDYVFHVFARMWVISCLLGHTKLLYANPTARISLGLLVSLPFPKSGGTRQSCLLFTLLFAIAMEPLAIQPCWGGRGAFGGSP